MSQANEGAVTDAAESEAPVEGHVNDTADTASNTVAAADSSQPESTGSPVSEAESLEVPEWLPSKFVKDGKPNMEALAKSYSELEKKLHTKSPQAPDEYKLNLPDDYTIPENDILYSGFSQLAKEANLSQEVHDQILNMFIDANAKLESQQPELWEAHLREEYAKLGPDADKRMTALTAWARNNMGEQDADILRNMATNADEFRVLESLMSVTRDKRLPRAVDTVSNTPDAAKCREMRYAKTESGDLRYAVDKAYRAEVDRMYEEVYGAGPDSRIVSGMG